MKYFLIAIALIAATYSAQAQCQSVWQEARISTVQKSGNVAVCTFVNKFSGQVMGSFQIPANKINSYQRGRVIKVRPIKDRRCNTVSYEIK